MVAQRPAAAWRGVDKTRGPDLEQPALRRTQPLAGDEPRRPAAGHRATRPTQHEIAAAPAAHDDRVDDAAVLGDGIEQPCEDRASRGPRGNRGAPAAAAL